MIRKITLRAWDNINNKWAYFTIGEIWTEVAFGVYRRIVLNGGKFYQFTGLRDKHGKEIFEGDFIRQANGFIWECYWQDENCEWLIKRNGAFDTEPKTVFCRLNAIVGYNELYEVIGNIQENPELVK